MSLPPLMFSLPHGRNLDFLLGGVAIHQHREDDDDARGADLPVGVDAHQSHHVGDEREDKRADDHAEDVAVAALEGRCRR